MEANITIPHSNPEFAGAGDTSKRWFTPDLKVQQTELNQVSEGGRAAARDLDETMRT